MNQRIEKYKFSQAAIDSFKGFLGGSVLSMVIGVFIVVPFFVHVPTNKQQTNSKQNRTCMCVFRLRGEVMSHFKPGQLAVLANDDQKSNIGKVVSLVRWHESKTRHIRQHTP